jgi:tetratricopeptide (TPR) repeat protein
VHPLIREYFTKRLNEQQTKAFQFAHRRLFNHLQKITPDRPSLLVDEIQHLYQAIVHGCHAGCFVHAFKDVYYRRIQNRNAWHATNKLGLVGADWSALSHFFTKPWTVLDPRLSLEIAQRVTRQAAFSLRASGQLAEAESVGTLALSLAQQAPDERRSDIISATQLSAVKLLLGKLNEAILNGEVAVALSANYQGKDIERLVSPRCTLANALFHGGNRSEAERSFEDAERIEKAEFPVLGELQAYVFHLLILSEAERSVWKLVVNSSNSLSPLTRAAVEACCKSVEDRLNLRQRVDEQPMALVSKGLALMSLGQISLFRRVFDRATSSSNQQNSHELWHATIVSCLRSSGQLQFVGEALAGAALASHLDGDQEGASADLEEAQSIAERGPMPLLLADVHLHRARLFGRLPKDERLARFPDINPKAELAEARRLIEKHGYWRRKEELEDAEAVAIHW